MPDDSFPVEVLGGVPVLAAPEEIDITNAAALRSALLTAAANGHGALVVDMTRTRFCDLSGLHALIASHKRAQADGREVLLVIPSVAVTRVLALTGMDTVIPNFTSLAEALARTAATANGRSRQRDEGDAAPAGCPIHDPHAGTATPAASSGRAAESARRTYEGVHGGTVFDHEWDQIGTKIRLESLLVRALQQVAEHARPD